jgi:hypothetical protein
LEQGKSSKSVCQGRPLLSLNPEVSSGLETVICKALEKDRTLRYLHASDIELTCGG